MSCSETQITFITDISKNNTYLSNIKTEPKENCDITKAYLLLENGVKSANYNKNIEDFKSYYGKSHGPASEETPAAETQIQIYTPEINRIENPDNNEEQIRNDCLSKGIEKPKKEIENEEEYKMYKDLRFAFHPDKNKSCEEYKDDTKKKAFMDSLNDKFRTTNTYIKNYENKTRSTGGKSKKNMKTGGKKSKKVRFQMKKSRKQKKQRKNQTIRKV